MKLKLPDLSGKVIVIKSDQKPPMEEAPVEIVPMEEAPAEAIPMEEDRVGVSHAENA